MAQALGISKAMVSKLTGKGMPLTSAQAAQAWRETNAPPRQWKAKANSSKPSPITPRPKPSSAPTPALSPGSDSSDDPAESLRRAKQAEKASYKKLELLQRDATSSPEDIRKLSSVYFAARNNHARAQSDYRQWQRDEQVTMFLDEAKEITSRGHLAAHGLLQTAAKTLAVRCHGQSVKAIESTIGDWIDRLTETLRQSF